MVQDQGNNFQVFYPDIFQISYVCRYYHLKVHEMRFHFKLDLVVKWLVLDSQPKDRGFELVAL